MRNHNLVEIDAEKLKRQILKRGYTFKTASIEIGKSYNYFSKATNEGTLPASTVLLIDRVLGIDESLYVIKEEPEKEPEASPDIVRALAILLARTEPEKLKEIVREVIQEVL